MISAYSHDKETGDDVTRECSVQIGQNGKRLRYNGSSDKCVFHGVRGIDLEGEEFKISISISLALHGFDLVVGGLQRSCGDGIVVVGEECGPMSSKSLGEFLEYSDTGDLGSGDPVFEKAVCRCLVLLFPE